MYNVVRRIEELTGIDLQNKSIFELYASLCEEVGELSRELKIEERSFGNAHKAPDEGSEIESVDVAICALALYFARGGKIEDLEEVMSSKLDKWERSQNEVPIGPESA